MELSFIKSLGPKEIIIGTIASHLDYELQKIIKKTKAEFETDFEAKFEIWNNIELKIVGTVNFNKHDQQINSVKILKASFTVDMLDDEVESLQDNF